MRSVNFLLGLSIVQNGKIPTFIGVVIKRKVFSSELEANEACISELQEGLKKVGIYQVCSQSFYSRLGNVTVCFEKNRI